MTSFLKKVPLIFENVIFKIKRFKNDFGKRVGSFNGFEKNGFWDDFWGKRFWKKTVLGS